MGKGSIPNNPVIPNEFNLANVAANIGIQMGKATRDRIKKQMFPNNYNPKNYFLTSIKTFLQMDENVLKNTTTF